MRVLITGASGNLGLAIAKQLRNNKFAVETYSRNMKLSKIDWHSIDVVVNCAAAIPSQNTQLKDYIDGNILFLQRLLSYSIGKRFIHFSTLSELFRCDFYQRTKMIANSILIANAHIFSELNILSLPTLDDEKLIASIVNAAKEGLMPTVDDLDYNFMSFENVSEYVLSIINENIIGNISDLYTRKNLYSEVIKRVSHEMVLPGQKVDRVLLEDGVYCVSPELLTRLLN